MVGLARRTEALARLAERVQTLWYEYGHESRPLSAARWWSGDFLGGADSMGTWRPGVAISGGSRPALVAETPSSAVFRVFVPRRASFVTEVGVDQSAWGEDRDRVLFSITARPLDGSPEETYSRWLNPAPQHRRQEWLRVRIPLGSFADKEIDLVLSSSSPTRAGIEAVWGEPALQVRRPLPQLVRLVRNYGQRYGKRRGLAKALRRLRSELAPEHSSYEAWMRRNRPRRAELASQAFRARRLRYRPLISLLALVEDSNATALAGLIESIRRQSYKFWEFTVVDCRRDPGADRTWAAMAGGDGRINVACAQDGASGADPWAESLAAAKGEFVALLGPDDELDPRALYYVVETLNRDPPVDFVYTDEDQIDGAGERFGAFFKPGWSFDYLLSCMYTGRLSVYRRSLVQATGGLGRYSGVAREWDLALRVGERTERVRHVPRVLYHRRSKQNSSDVSTPASPIASEEAKEVIEDYLHRNAIEGACEEGPRAGLVRVRYGIAGRPLVSILIPTSGRILEDGGSGLVPLGACIRSILEKTDYSNYEVVCVDDGSPAPATTEALSGVSDPRVRGVSFPGPFNFARKLNFAAGHAHGEHLLFLNDDTEVMNPDWLSAMLELSQRAQIGAVGAKLHFPDGGIQHGGVVFISGRPTHAFRGYPSDHPGYFCNLLVACNYSAVTAACMMTKRSAFTEVGGFNEAFPLNYNDVDYCLRLRERGYRIVFTPSAELRHFESLSREGKATPEELELLWRKWPIEYDPFYNQQFRQDEGDFTLGPQ